MADYDTPTVVQQTIPHADITPLEILLLAHIFTGEVDGEGWYFFAEQSPADIIMVARRELLDGLNASRDCESEANAVVEKCLTEQPDAAEVEIDISVIAYDFILHDIVRRSATLKYISVVAAFTCSRMRPDGFGGMAIVITPDRVAGKSTHDIIADILGEQDIEP